MLATVPKPTQGETIMKPTLRKIASQPSWLIRNKDVELAVTQLGGHMAPVTFYRAGKSPVQPYYINPWHAEELKIDEPVLRPLRGDFFCMPFGENAEASRGAKHDVHGEPAGGKWTLVSAEAAGDVKTLALSMRTRSPAGKITKRLSLVNGQNIVYVQHTLEGFSERMPLGHHATLAMPQREESVHVATSPIRFGRTNPTLTEDATAGQYQSVAPNRRFRSPSQVQLLWRRPLAGDFTAYPTRKGFGDLVALFNKPMPGRPAWTTATYEDEGFLWFSLKDPAVLPTTLLWVANCGRHDPPWNGRNQCLGLEDICGFFAEGVPESVRANILTKDGIATAIKLSPKRPTVVNYIEGVVKVPRGFTKVSSAEFESGRVTFLSTTGKKAAAAVNHSFLWTGEAR